jgi:peptidoglycan/LPS O-acetylase OafA/YrhL
VAPGARRRLPQLDGIRGLAILLVMCSHFGQRFDNTSLLPRAVADVLGSGWIGVELFFALSGFLITGILVDALGSRHWLGNFYIRRALRLCPPYFALVAILVFVVPLLAPWVGSAESNRTIAANQGWYWTYSMNLLLAKSRDVAQAPYGTAALWSLGVEEQFYLLWPLFVMFLSPRGLRRVCAVSLVVCLAIRVMLNLWAHNALAGYMLMPARFDSLAVGAWLALAQRDASLAARLRGWAMPALLAATAVVAGVTMLTSAHRIPNFSLSGQTLGLPALAVASAALIVLALAGARGTSWTKGAALRYLGKYSYAMYLIFTPVATIFLSRGLLVAPHLRTAGALALSAGVLFDVGTQMAVTLLLALVSWHLIERPFLRMKAAFRTPTVQLIPVPVAA